jgi:hypothetical protein
VTKGIHTADSRRISTSLRWCLVAPALLALALASVLAWTAPVTVNAHAPGIAVAEVDLALLENPASEAAVLGELAAGSEMELTGRASDEYVEVIAAGITGWVDVNTIHAGQIQTATTNALTQITDAPSEDGRLLTVVPAGDTVILTGAAVDEYLAGSYNGTGGWLPAANFNQ